VDSHDDDDDDDDAGFEKLLTRPPDLSVSPTSRDIWYEQEEWTKE
jgi:hypothetical protein